MNNIAWELAQRHKQYINDMMSVQKPNQVTIQTHLRRKQKISHTSGAIHLYVPVSAVITPD